MRDKSEYALLWANGMSFADLFDLMKADIEAEEAAAWDLSSHTEEGNG